jgi:hypothetical protein
MSQSMNGMEFYSSGISETDNLTCNNISCNNISSNGIVTNTLTSQQMNTTTIVATTFSGTTANIDSAIHVGIGEIIIYNGDIFIIVGNGNLIVSRHVKGELLDLGGNVLTSNIVANLNGLTYNVQNSLSRIINDSDDIVLGTTAESIIVPGLIDCYGEITCKKLNISFGSGASLDYYILSNLQGLTSNVESELKKTRSNSGLAVTSGINNTIFGNFSSPQLKTGSYNVSIGQDTLTDLVSGSNNIGIGYDAGKKITGSYNTCIGFESGQDITANYTQSVALGYQAKFDSSNQISIGTTNETTVIKGKLNVEKLSTFTLPVVCSATPTLSSHLVNKSYVDSFISPKVKFGQCRATTNTVNTVFFSTPFPVGSLPIVQLTVNYIGNGTLPGFVYLADYAYTYFAYGYLYNNAHAESLVLINWLAMIP